MKYLPFEDFEIHTHLSSDEVYYRLCAAVDTERKWLIFTNKPFWGEVDRRDFRIWRATWWNRNIGPVVSGKIWSEGLDCCVVVRMRMPWFGFLFNSFAFGFIWLSFFIGHANLAVQKIQTGIWQIESFGEWLLNVLLYSVFLVFLYLLSIGVFKSQVCYVKDYLLWMSQTDKEKVVYRNEFLGLTEPQIIKSLFVVTFIISLGWIVFGLLQ